MTVRASRVGFGSGPFGDFRFGWGDWAEIIFVNYSPSVYWETDSKRKKQEFRKFINGIKPSFQQVRELLEVFPNVKDPALCPITVLPFLAGDVGYVDDQGQIEERRRSAVLEAFQLYLNKGTETGYGIVGAFNNVQVSVEGLYENPCGSQVFVTKPPDGLVLMLDVIPGFVTNGRHYYAVTFVGRDGVESAPGSVAVIKVRDNTVNGRVLLASIPLGPPDTIARRIYRTSADMLDFKLLATIADNTTRIYTDSAADSALGTPPILNADSYVATFDDVPADIFDRMFDDFFPTGGESSLALRFNASFPAPTLVNGGAGNVEPGQHLYLVTFFDGASERVATTVGSIQLAALSQVNLTNIPIGPAGTLQRRIYRTVANGAQFRLLNVIADNATTVYTDNTGDGGLGSFIPIAPENTTAPLLIDVSSVTISDSDEGLVTTLTPGVHYTANTVDLVAGVIPLLPNSQPAQKTFRPAAGTTVLTLDENALSAPTLFSVTSVTKNGAALAVGPDYATNLAAGTITLVQASAADDVFVVLYVTNGARRGVRYRVHQDVNVFMDLFAANEIAFWPITLDQTKLKIGTTPTLIVTGAGAVDLGRHAYFVTFFDGVSEVAGAPQNAINLAVASQVTVSDVPIGPAGTLQRRIYRTTANGAQFQFLAMIPDNTTTIYVDNVADSGLGASLVPSALLEPITFTGDVVYSFTAIKTPQVLLTLPYRSLTEPRLVAVPSVFKNGNLLTPATYTVNADTGEVTLVGADALPGTAGDDYDVTMTIHAQGTRCRTHRLRLHLVRIEGAESVIPASSDEVVQKIRGFKPIHVEFEDFTYEVSLPIPMTPTVSLQVRPTPLAISPTTGNPGTFVTVTGLDFDSMTVARIAGVPLAGQVFVDATTITGFTPVGPLGPQDVTTTNVNGTGTLVNGFTNT